MNFTFTSSKRVIAKLYSDYNLQVEARTADVIEWIGEASEYIGATAQFTNSYAELSIENHRAMLPCNFVEVNQVTQGNRVLTHAQKTAHVSLPDGNHTHKLFQEKNVYYIYDKCIITSFESGKINLYYYGSNVDSEGYPLIPNTLRYIDAVISYIMMKVKTAECFSGRISPNELDYYKMDFEIKCQSAASQIAMPTVDQAIATGKRHQRIMQVIDYSDIMYSDNGTTQYSK